MRPRLLAIIALGVVSSGCYHVTVVTGAPESSTVIDRPWQLSLVAGLVPPPEIQADERCNNGVAKVETERSFLNSVVAILSSNLITPMSTRVTCAATRPSPEVSPQGVGRSEKTTEPGSEEPSDTGTTARSGSADPSR